MSIFSKLFGKKKEDPIWTTIKTSDTVYPKNSISILKLKTKSGKLGTGWVDKAYDKYAYKKFCAYNVLIKADLTDNIAQNNPDLDMGTVEDYFLEKLRKTGIAHIVARLVTDDGMNIEMYVEKDKEAVKQLQTMQVDSNRLVSFDTEINKDPDWSAVSGLMDL